MTQKVKLTLCISVARNASGSWLDDITRHTIDVRYSGLYVYERSNSGEAFVIEVIQCNAF